MLTTGSIVGTSTLYVVERVLTSIAVTADNATLAHGLSQQYTATGTYSDNTTGTTSISNVTGDVHWTVTGRATITNSGYLTTTGVGAVVVTAHIYDLPIATANLNVTDKELVRIGVTPAEAQVAKGWTKTFTAAGVYTDGSNYPETGSFAVTTWASLNPTYANNLSWR